MSTVNSPFTSSQLDKVALLGTMNIARWAYIWFCQMGMLKLSWLVVWYSMNVWWYIHVQCILGFCIQDKDHSNGSGQDKDVSGSIHYINGMTAQGFSFGHAIKKQNIR